MSVTLTLSPLVFVREHAHGASYAFPIADPRLLARGDTPEEALDELRYFLQERLAKCPAGDVAPFIYGPDASLLDVAAVVPRADLSHRLSVSDPITVPCVVVPDGRAHWVHVLPLSHTLHVKPTEDLQRRVADEITRAAAAAALSGQEYLRVLPTPSHRLLRLELEVERVDAEDLTRRAANRCRAKDEQQQAAARKLLALVGTELLSDSRSRSLRPPVLGRDREIRTLASLLSGSDRLSVMLVGEPLAGKTAVLHGLLSQSVARFTAHPIYATSGAQLVAGQSGFGQLQQRVDDVMAATELLDAVLYFDDYGDLFAGHSGSIEDLAAMMRPWIADGRVRVVGELSPEVLEHHEKRHVAFFAAMHRVTVPASDAALTKAILAARTDHQANVERDRPRLQRACIDPLVELSERYLVYQAFPGKAVLLADELRAVHEGEFGDDGSPRAVAVHDVYRAFAVRSGIPMFLLRDEEGMRYTEVLEFLSRRVIGQREALESVAQALCTVKAGLQPPNKPLANLLFVGPTGVGKTEVAKTLARFLYGGTDKLVRFDMSEYGDVYASERLIRGTDREDGELTRRVRQQPFCVVLLDEIEKAHPAVFDLLLQVLGEGRLSDARGRTTSFVNSIVIMTSNLGATHRRPRSGFSTTASDDQDLHRYYLEQVDRHFRPEFVNRLDRVITFASLGTGEIARVARVALDGLMKREGIAGRGIDFAVSDRALAELATAGYSDTYGARALRRHLEDSLVAPVARLLSDAGADAEGASLGVVLAEHEDADAAGLVAGPTTVGHAVAGKLAFTLTRRPTKGERRATFDLRAIALMRRTAAACCALEPVQELRDRVAYLVAELSRSNERGRAVMPAAVQEHARLAAWLEGIDDAMEALEGAEDLAAAAAAEGEACDAFVEEAERAQESFERAFVGALLSTHGLNEALLLVRAHRDAPRLVQWLRALLQAAEDRSWRVLVHRWEDPLLDPDWPRALPWGPPRDRAWVEASLTDADEDEIAKHWRGVLVRLAGPRVGALMCFEAGLHRFVGDTPEDAEHLEVRLPMLTFNIDNAKIASEPFALGKLPERAAQRNTLAVREYDAAHSRVHAVRAGQSFELDPQHYWSVHERIVFSIMADALMRGEDALPGGSQWS